MVPCLNRGNLWLQQSVVPKIHPSHNKASQTEVDVVESTVLKVYRQLQPSTQRQIFAWINIKILDRRPNSKKTFLLFQKMVCTTVRPTSMRYPELQHWQGCADFIADHIVYRPISHPTRLVSQHTTKSYELCL